MDERTQQIGTMHVPDAVFEGYDASGPVDHDAIAAYD